MDFIHEIEGREIIYNGAFKVKIFPEDRPLSDHHPFDSEVALRGAMWVAGQTLVADLFHDVLRVRTSDDPIKAVADDTFYFKKLPENYRGFYTTTFAENFVVAAVDMTSRISRGWTRLACAAQEFAFEFWLDEIEVCTDVYGLSCPEGWRGDLEDRCLEDYDYEAHHYIPADGFVNSILELVPVERWFQPFHNDVTLPPFLE